MSYFSTAGILAVFLLLVQGGRSATECYGDLGCFTDAGCHSTSFPPERPEFINTRFYLYTRNNPTVAQELVRDNSNSLAMSNFDGFKKTKFTIHGWNSDSESFGEVDRRDAFLEAEDVNVIMVDWRAGAAGVNYPKQHQNTRVVGREVGLFARFLYDNAEVNYADIHIVGHSLGAHTAGYAGEFQPGIGRISGTDPAGPGFRYDGPECRLDPTDAIFVDVIHVDGNENIGLGTMLEMGHQDFYPNGGRHQPACRYGGDVIGCSHAYSNYYFNESIRSRTCQFNAYPCASPEDWLSGTCVSCGLKGCSEMGYHSIDHPSASGTYFLDTNDAEPFCMG